MDLQREYLKALGASYFVPRFVLPGAAPSSQAPLPVAEARVDVAPIDEAQLTAESPAAVTAPLEEREAPPALSAEHRPAMPVLEDSAAAKSREERREAQASTESPDVSFQAALVDTGIGLLMVAPSPSEGLDAGAKRLMANIARALAVHQGTANHLAFAAADFAWPMAKVPGLKMDAAAARDAFSASLRSRSDKHGLRCILLFGAELAPYVDADLLGAGARFLNTASVTELMQDATAKAVLWQALRSLPPLSDVTP